MSSKSLCQWLEAAAGLIGVLALFGWIADIPALYGGGLGLAPMKPSTALLFLVASGAFLLEGDGATGDAGRRGGAVTRAVLAAITVAAGLAILTSQLPWGRPGSEVVGRLLAMGPAGQYVGMPSMLTGAAFTLLGAAVLVRKDAPSVRAPLLYSALAIALFAALGMLFIATIPDTSLFHQLAFPTAIGLALLALGGLLADADRGVVAALRSSGPASIYLKFSLLTAVGVPVVLGWIRVYLHREYAMPVEAGIAVYAVSMIVVFSVFATLTARTVDRLDAGASAFLQAAPDAMLVVDGGGTIRRANARAAELFDVPGAALTGTAVDVLLPGGVPKVEAETPRAVEAPAGSTSTPAGYAMKRSLMARRHDGTEFRAELSLSPLQSGEGHFVIAAVSDVTDRYRAQMALHQSEVRFREAFANAAVGVALVGLAGEWLQVNQNYCRLLGYSEAELRGLTFADVTHPDDLEADLHLLRQLEAGEIPRYELDKRYLHKSGRVVYVRLSVSIVRSVDGAPLHYIAIVQDVTESRQAQAELAETVLLQQAILQGANLSIISTNADGIITTFNAAAERMLGYRAEELVGKSTPAILHDAAEVATRASELSRIIGTTVEPEFEAFVALARRGVADENEWSYVRKDGSRLPVRLSVTALKSPDGLVEGFLGIAADIREQRRAAQQMRESLEEKETLLREIHHRVKNNLQVVSSLLSLQANASPFPELKLQFDGARDRIRSMAMIHEQLYRSQRLSQIHLLAHLKELVQLQVAAHGGAAADLTCEVSGDESTVSIDCAIPVGLIANELVSNAFKHGARGSAAAPIDIKLSRVGPTRFALRIWNAASDAPRPGSLERSGALGLRLVNALLGQVDGELETDLSHGVAFCVTFSDTSQTKSFA